MSLAALTLVLQLVYSHGGKTDDDQPNAATPNPIITVGDHRTNFSVDVTPAAFGVDQGPVSGSLVFYGPGYSSTDGCGHARQNSSPWIAVIPRGGCSFVEKALLAQAANASAIVIYDYYNGDLPNSLPAPVMCGSPIDGMGGNVTIPVVAITYEEYTQILVKPHKGYLSAFTPQPSSRCMPDDDFDDDDPFHWHHGFDSSMLPVLLVGAMLVLTLGGALAALHYYVYVRRRRALLAAQGHLDAGLAWQDNESLDAVNELPCKVYMPLDEEGNGAGADAGAGAGAGAELDTSTVTIAVVGHEGEGADGASDTPGSEPASGSRTSVSSDTVSASHEDAHCSICLEDFEPGQRQRVLPCGHVFHAPCVDEWLLSGLRSARHRSECPLCKQDPLPDRTRNPPPNPHMASLITMLNAHAARGAQRTQQRQQRRAASAALQQQAGANVRSLWHRVTGRSGGGTGAGTGAGEGGGMEVGVGMGSARRPPRTGTAAQALVDADSEGVRMANMASMGPMDASAGTEAVTEQPGGEQEEDIEEEAKEDEDSDSADE